MGGIPPGQRSVDGRLNMKKLTLITAALLLSFALTAFCGMAMSSYALPFLYGIVKITFSQRREMITLTRLMLVSIMANKH